MPSIVINGNKVGGTVDDATLIRYNNEDSSLEATRIQDAITELDEKVNENLTEAKEYADGVKNDLLNGAGTAYDTLKELGDLIDDNTDALDVVEVLAATNKSTLETLQAEVTANKLTAGTGLSNTNGTLSVSYGTAAGTACQGNDSRLSNARTPVSHASTATTYGIGNASNYGHVKLSDTYASAVSNGAAANGLLHLKMLCLMLIIH